MQIGQAIKRVRLRRAVKQKDLAGAIGVSQSLLSLIEKGEREPSFSLLGKIARSLRVPEQLLALYACEYHPRGKRYKKSLHQIAAAADKLLVTALATES